MPKVYAIDGLTPAVDPSAFVHPSAVLIGDVIVAARNVQDTCLLHGCVVRRGALIGRNCVVNDNAEVGEDAMVAALAFVKAEARIPCASTRSSASAAAPACARWKP